MKIGCGEHVEMVNTPLNPIWNVEQIKKIKTAKNEAYVELTKKTKTTENKEYVELIKMALKKLGQN